ASCSAVSRSPTRRRCSARPRLSRSCRRSRVALLSLTLYSVLGVSTWVTPPLGRTKVSREQPVAASTTTSAASSSSRGGIAQALFSQMAVELGLAAGPVHHLPLQLAAGGIDVVAARAPHHRQHLL